MENATVTFRQELLSALNNIEYYINDLLMIIERGILPNRESNNSPSENDFLEAGKLDYEPLVLEYLEGEFTWPVIIKCWEVSYDSIATTVPKFFRLINQLPDDVLGRLQNQNVDWRIPLLRSIDEAVRILFRNNAEIDPQKPDESVTERIFSERRIRVEMDFWARNIGKLSSNHKLIDEKYTELAYAFELSKAASNPESMKSKIKGKPQLVTYSGGLLESPTGRVKIYGERDPVFVDEAKQAPLRKNRYQLIRALIEAGDKGLTKDELAKKSGSGGARKTLGRMAEDPIWKPVISMATETGKGYRIL